MSAELAGEQVRPMVQVWDLPTRVFHWSLVAGVGTALITGFVTPEWWMGVHKWSGYAVVGLMAFRMLWGLFGPEYSRFDSLARTSLKAGDHLRGLLLLRPVHSLDSADEPLGYAIQRQQWMSSCCGHQDLVQKANGFNKGYSVGTDRYTVTIHRPSSIRRPTKFSWPHN